MDTRTILATAALFSAGAPACVHAQGVATDKLIDAITVTGLRERAGVEVPNPTASKTADELRTQNLFNPEDALNYLPNLTIRKRYIGDRNALIGGRSFSTLQAPRGLVLMDGYLLSNFLGRFDAPRWNMISPAEIDRVDVLYGPNAPPRTARAQRAHECVRRKLRPVRAQRGLRRLPGVRILRRPVRQQRVA